MKKFRGGFARRFRPLAFLSVLLAVAGAAARFDGLGTKTFWLDEIATIRTCAGYERLELINTLFAPPIRTGDLAARLWTAPRREPGAIIDVLAREDQNHTPLYYLATRFWMDAFGWSPAGARSLAAIFGVLAIGAAFFTGSALQDRRTGLILAVLVAVSPYHLAYAQEAREYAFWGLMLFLWTAAFARALVADNRTGWIVYGVTTALAHYAHPLSLVVAFAHFGGVLGWHRAVLRRFVAAAALAALLFSPWVLVYLSNMRNSGVIIGWTEVDLTVLSHAQSLLSILARPFFDISAGRTSPIMDMALAAAVVTAAVCGLKRASLPTRIAVSAVLLSIPVVFLSADIFTGGRRNAVARFHSPTVVGLEIAVALALSGLSRARLAAALGLLVAAGVASAVAYRSSPTWWSKGRAATDAEVARIIHEPGTLATTLPSNTNPLYLMSLARHLDPSLPVVVLRPNEPPPAMRRPVYVLSPSAWAMSAIKEMGGVRVAAPRPLWKIGSETGKPDAPAQ